MVETKLSPDQLLNRSYNLISTVALFVAGLAFGPVMFYASEEPIDKIDDIGLLLVGIAVAVWYFLGRNRFSRTIIPIIFAVAALAFQIFGDIVEHDDEHSLSDNIGGSWVVIAVLIIIVFQYIRTKKLSQV